MKVISYSLWGNQDRYILPLLNNVEIAAELFADWHIVVYVSDSLNETVKDKLKRHGCSIYECGESPDTRGAFWRFKSLILPDVEAVLFRDADSMLTPRDKAMVDCWLASNRDFYLCRDHPSHTRPIAAGLWGVRGKGISQIREIAKFDPIYANYGDDEKFLAQFVYLKHRKSFMIFAPYLLYPGEKNEEFDYQSTDYTDYLGRVYAVEDNRQQDEIMKKIHESGRHVGTRRFFVPYSTIWKIAHWMAKHLLKKKDVQDWRDFSKEVKKS